MRKIGFVGAYDKVDLILNIAKVLTLLGKKVLVVDSTVLQKAKYIVPNISPNRSYITQYQNFDVAIGFSSFEAIEEYIKTVDGTNVNYDIVLIDCDSYRTFSQFKLVNADINYFITIFDAYSIKRGTEILRLIQEPVHFIKILFSNDMVVEDDEYLNHITKQSEIIWEEDKIYFPIDIQDILVNIENEKVSNIKLKRLSNVYKESLAYIIQQIEPISEKQITKIIKNV